MVNRQIGGRTAINAAIIVPELDLISPHSFRIRTAKGEEVMHEASGAVHRWLITSKLIYRSCHYERDYDGAIPIPSARSSYDSDLYRPFRLCHGGASPSSVPLTFA